ncbi:MAG TPA: tyrosine-type recombinase/integrase [Candidatus Aquicultor sp.]|jgi:integrase
MGLDKRSLVRHVLKPACQKAGVLQIGFHGLRHSYISLLANQGESIKTIQALAGHSEERTTLRIYTHLYDDSKRKAVDRLNDFATTVLPRDKKAGLSDIDNPV